FCQADDDIRDRNVTGVQTCALPISHELSDGWACRNNRLAELGLHQDGFFDAVARARLHYSPQRIGVFLGTSTSGIGATEAAYGRSEERRVGKGRQYEEAARRDRSAA